MDERQLQDFARLLAHLLPAMEGLADMARYLHPTPLSVLLEALGRPDEFLKDSSVAAPTGCC